MNARTPIDRTKLPQFERDREAKTVNLITQNLKTRRIDRSVFEIANFSRLSRGDSLYISRDFRIHVRLALNRGALISRVIDAWIRGSRRLIARERIVNAWGAISQNSKAETIYKGAIHLFFLYIFLRFRNVKFFSASSKEAFHLFPTFFSHGPTIRKWFIRWTKIAIIKC